MGPGTSNQFSACPLARQQPELFASFVSHYSDIVELAVQEVVTGTDRHVFAKVRSLARRAGEETAVPQDLIAVHLSALAILVQSKPQAMVRACIRHSRLLLVKMIGELALYYREQAIRQRQAAQ
jgi:hypothetical protein